MRLRASARGGCWLGLCMTLFGAAALAQATAQSATKASAATPGKGPVDLSGVWVIPSSHDNPLDRSAFPQSEWSTAALPFTPEGRAAFEANKPGRGPRQVQPAMANDPQLGANPAGLYRTLMYSRPFEFVQVPGKIVQLFGWGLAWRYIHDDGRPVPKDVPAGPFWFGYSVGKWDGDTLVVNTLALDERAWLDEWGTPYSAEARFEERWRRSGDQLQLTITVHDPLYYTKAWTSSPVTYALQRRVEPNEVIFAPMDMELFNTTLRDPAQPHSK